MTDSTATRLQQALDQRPDVLAHLEAADDAAWRVTDAELLDLCRIRIAMLLGSEGDARIRRSAVDEDLVAALATWPASDRFNAAQRAALAYTEQNVIDVASMDDATVAALARELGDEGMATFANALLVIEQRIRLRLIWETLGIGAAA